MYSYLNIFQSQHLQLVTTGPQVLEANYIIPLVICSRGDRRVKSLILQSERIERCYCIIALTCEQMVDLSLFAIFDFLIFFTGQKQERAKKNLRLELKKTKKQCFDYGPLHGVNGGTSVTGQKFNCKL